MILSGGGGGMLDVEQSGGGGGILDGTSDSLLSIVQRGGDADCAGFLL